MRADKIVMSICLLAFLLAGTEIAYADFVATGTGYVNAADYTTNAPAVRWHDTYSGTDGNGMAGVSRTSDGGFILVGFTDSFSENRDIYLLKLGPDGRKQWDSHYSGEHNATGLAVSETPDGYIIAGSILLPQAIAGSQTSPDAIKHQYMYLIKTDRQGNKVWDKTYENPVYEEQNHYQWQFANVIIPTGDGYVVGGGWAAWAGFSLKTPILMKLDLNANRVWDMMLKSGWYQYPDRVIKTSDGGYLLLSNESHLTKTDQSGGIQWEKEYLSDKILFLTDVLEIPGDGYLLGGYTESSDFKHDGVFIKVDSAGGQEWNRTVYRDNLVDITAICRTADGGYAAVGTVNEYYTYDKYNWSSYNLYVLMLDSAGHLQWEKDIVGKTGDIRFDEYGKAIGQTSDGSLIVLGDSTIFLRSPSNHISVVSLGTGGNAPATSKTPNSSCLPLLLLPVLSIISLAIARKKKS